MTDIQYPLVTHPYSIGDHISYITQFGDIKNGWIKDIKDYDAAKRRIVNSDSDNSPRVFERYYYFTQTRNSTTNPIRVHYRYVERLPDRIIIRQKWLIDNLVNENIPDYLRGPIPEYPDRVAGNTGGTGETSGGRRKRTRRHRSRRNRSRRFR